MNSTIILSVVIFLLVSLLLIGLLLYAKTKLTSSGKVKIIINGEKNY